MHKELFPTEGAFSREEWLRYTRHIQLPSIGAEGQKALKQAKIVVVGAGGLGSPVLFYLAAAGVGHLTVIDSDSVDVTNLQRQILFTTQDIQQSKVYMAKQHLQALNPYCEVMAVQDDFHANNAGQWVRAADLVIDCTDNFTTRYLINQVCLDHQTPWVFASIHQFAGQCALFTTDSACFRCLFPEPPSEAPDCNQAGVLGVLPGLLGTIQANEALKYLLGLPGLKNQLLMVDALALTFKKIQLSKDSHCSSCGDGNASLPIQTSCNNAVENDDMTYGITQQQLQAYAKSDICLLDVRTDAERQAFHRGGLHIPLSELKEQYSVLPSK